MCDVINKCFYPNQCHVTSIKLILFLSRSFSLSEFNETTEVPHAIEEEETIIEAEITFSGSDQETTKLDLRSSTDESERLDVGSRQKSRSPSEPISTLCLTMRRQIISRFVLYFTFNWINLKLILHRVTKNSFFFKLFIWSLHFYNCKC